MRLTCLYLRANADLTGKAGPFPDPPMARATRAVNRLDPPAPSLPTPEQSGPWLDPTLTDTQKVH
jgi:hypothetical protein